GFQIATRVGIEHRPSAGGQHEPVPGEKSDQRFAFAAAKPGLALGGEDLADARTGGLFENGVGIGPLPAESIGQRRRDGGFPAPAIPDQRDHHHDVLAAEIACRSAARITSRGASRPVNSSNCRAAWRTNISTPVTVTQPRSRPYLTSSVRSGL